MTATGLFPVNANPAASYANSKRTYKQRPMQSAKKPRKPKVPGVDRRKLAPSPLRDEVAALLAAGLEFKDIATRTGLTVKSVRRHFDKIRERLGPQAI